MSLSFWSSLFPLVDARTYSVLRRQQIETFYSPTGVRIRGALVETSKEWRKQKKALLDSGIMPSVQSIFLEIVRCDICRVGVGPGHVEEYLYLYPVYKKHECVGDRIRYFESSWLKICGSCAHDRRRQLPEWLRILDPYFWQTTILICQEGEDVRPSNVDDYHEQHCIRRAIDQYILVFHRYIFSILLFLLNIPITRVFSFAVPYSSSTIQPIAGPSPISVSSYTSTPPPPVSSFPVDSSSLSSDTRTLDDVIASVLSPKPKRRSTTFDVTSMLSSLNA